jgi:hypothetical protein
MGSPYIPGAADVHFSDRKPFRVEFGPGAYRWWGLGGPVRYCYSPSYCTTPSLTGEFCFLVTRILNSPCGWPIHVHPLGQPGWVTCRASSWRAGQVYRYLISGGAWTPRTPLFLRPFVRSLAAVSRQSWLPPPASPGCSAAHKPSPCQCRRRADKRETDETSEDGTRGAHCGPGKGTLGTFRVRL